MPTTNVVPGSVDIKNLNLFSFDRSKTYNLLENYMSIDIYEDILKPSIYAEITIHDTSGIHEAFPIMGEEFIELEYETPGGEITCKYTLFCYSTSNEVATLNEKGKTYVLHCVSYEYIKGINKLINKSYDAPISYIIKDVLQNVIQTDKPYYVENTRGSQSLILSNKKPWEALDLVRRRAVSIENDSHSFVLFENKNGYFFNTIENLYKLGIPKIGDKVFFFDNQAQRVNFTDSINIRNVIGYNYIGKADNANRLARGGLHNSTTFFDIVKKTFSKIPTTFNVDNYKFGDDKNYSTSSAKMQVELAKEEAITLFFAKDSSRNDTFLDNSIGNIAVYVNQLVQSMVNVHLYGDTSMAAGDCITLNIPAFDNSDTQPESRLYSQNYLIARLRHRIIIKDETPFHTMACQLVKGAFTEPK
jgi:hypothetical protein